MISVGNDDIIVVMGVSGSGKSTLAHGLASALGCEFAEGDDFHPEANVRKMRAGVPLTDDDRWPWLDALAGWIESREQAGEPAVVTCSALRRSYRDRLRRNAPHVRFLHVSAPPEVIHDRIERRTDHFMPASLLTSQLAGLEPLEPDEPGVAVTNEGTPDEVLDRALRALGCDRAGA